MITQPTVEEAQRELVRAPLLAGASPGTSIVRNWTGVRVLAFGSLVAIALAAALILATLPRWHRQQSLTAAAAARAAAPHRVTVTLAKRMAADAERVLPGNSLPLLEASLYARTNGYLKNRRVDIGDRVVQGQLLAEIAAPDVDAQLLQAQADVTQAKANLVKARADEDLAKTEESRYRKLLRARSVSQEEYDLKYRAVSAATAVVVASEAAIKVYEAAVQRYAALQGFQKITAPFAGVITARNVDPGDLLTADAPNTTREMFHLMRTDVLRVFVNVPQVFASGIKVGQSAFAFGRDDPKNQFAGKVTRTADALDPSTRTLLTQVDVPNPNDVLRAGMYLQVKFVFDRNVMPVMIPAAALAMKSGAPHVPVMTGDRRVQYRAVTLGRDFGAEIAVTSGLNDGETIIVHPGDDLPEGAEVEPVPTSK